MVEKNIYDYEDALESTLKYFVGNELPAKVFLDKYALRDTRGHLVEKSPTDMHMRLAKEFARVEEMKYKGSEMEALTVDEIYKMLADFKYIVPQGSPMYGIGNDYQQISLSNCFVVTSPKDSYGGIMSTDQELVQMSKRRGGVGLDLSNLRPKDARVENAARTSTGIVPFMTRYSNSIREVGQSGRRGALMISLSVHHPEITSFVTIKNDLTQVTGANISVRLSDEFLSAVIKDEDYELRFPVDYKEQGIEPVYTKRVNAKKVWDLIIKNAHAMAEPGLLFWDNIIKESLADRYEEFGFKTVSTNPCGEIPLSQQDSCRLLIVNLYSMVDNPFTKEATFNKEKFWQVTEIAQRLMDDLIDLEIEKLESILLKIKDDPEPEAIKRPEYDLWEKVLDNTKTGRRTGLGATAWGDMLAALGVGYGTEESVKIVGDISNILKQAAYQSSMKMAKAIGPFKYWNPDLEQDHPFLERIKDDNPYLYTQLMKYGRRNISLLTMAPTGCVTKDVVIKTDRGDINMETLFSINDIDVDNLKNIKNVWFDCKEDINVPDAEGNLHKINKLYWNGYTNGYKIKFSNDYEIKTSSEHKFLVLIEKNKGVWKKAIELREGDKIVKIK